MRPLGNVIYVLPPYAISARDLHFVHDQIAESLSLLDAL
jgi:adenosylmethionine-8-amino-7-oxononanoate aminotransferase